MRRNSRIAVLLLVALGFTGPGIAQSDSSPLRDLVDEEWNQRLQDDPLLATRVGDRRGLDRLPTMSIDAIRARAEQDRGYLERLAAIDRDALDDADRVTYDVFQWQLETRVGETDVGHYRFPLTSDTGFHIQLALLPSWTPLETTEDYEAYIARLGAIPQFVGEHLELLRDGIRVGWTQTRVVLEGYDVTIKSHVVEDVADSIFAKPFESFPPGVPEQARAGLREAGHEAVMKGAVAGYRSFLEFFESEYFPKARTSIGVSQMPDGEAYYANRVKRFTNIEISA
ncbi:MAG: DUF885 family protein, partial [Acidobacteriota bacterium]